VHRNQNPSSFKKKFVVYCISKKLLTLIDNIILNATFPRDVFVKSKDNACSITSKNHLLRTYNNPSVVITQAYSLKRCILITVLCEPNVCKTDKRRMKNYPN
jgi:hypothetical protein